MYRVIDIAEKLQAERLYPLAIAGDRVVCDWEGDSSIVVWMVNLHDGSTHTGRYYRYEVSGNYGCKTKTEAIEEAMAYFKSKI